MTRQSVPVGTDPDLRSLINRAMSLQIEFYKEFQALAAAERLRPSARQEDVRTIVELWHKAFGAVEDIEGYLFHWPALQHGAGTRLNREQFVLFFPAGLPNIESLATLGRQRRDFIELLRHPNCGIARSSRSIPSTTTGDTGSRARTRSNTAA